MVSNSNLFSNTAMNTASREWMLLILLHSVDNHLSYHIILIWAGMYKHC